MDIKRLKDQRKKNHLTQAEVASILGFTRQRYNFYETGRSEPDNDTLVQLAIILNTTTDFLLGKSDEFALEKKEDALLQQAEARVNKALEDIGLLKAGEELTVEEQLRIADFLIRNKEFILPDKNKDKQTHD